MKAKALILLIMVFVWIFISIYPALSEHEATIKPSEEWSWDNGSYNTFEGEINLSGFEGTILSIEMSTDLNYDNETDGTPVFSVVNGKRIPMKKQNGTIIFQPDDAASTLNFSGNIRMPEKQHINRIGFTFTIKNSQGNILDTVYAAIGGNSNDDIYYFTTDIRTISIVLTAAAAAVWAVAFARDQQYKKKHRNGE